MEQYTVLKRIIINQVQLNVSISKDSFSFTFTYSPTLYNDTLCTHTVSIVIKIQEPLHSFTLLIDEQIKFIKQIKFGTAHLSIFILKLENENVAAKVPLVISQKMQFKDFILAVLETNGRFYIICIIANCQKVSSYQKIVLHGSNYVYYLTSGQIIK